MLLSTLHILLVLAVVLSTLAFLSVPILPEVSFLLGMFALPVWVATAYGANMIQVPVLVNSTTEFQLQRSDSIQWISIFGLLMVTLILYLASASYAEKAARGGR